MSEYLHGAYGQTQAEGARVAQRSLSAMVYVGTAPVHTLEGGAANLNKPVLVNNIAEARRAFGYSDNWADYTLCEAMKVHLEQKGVGPLVLINVLNPATHKEATPGTATQKPTNGIIVIAEAEKVILDSVVVKTADAEPVTKQKGTDYTIGYNAAKQTITIAEMTAGALGTDNLNITWNIIKPDAVDNDDVIGASDGEGLNTGLFAVQNVYQETGYIPSFLLAPGFSGVPAIHAAMVANSKKINGHWDAYLFVDIPITHSGTGITMTSAKTWKEANGYNQENETVYFPLAQGVDGNIYHLSVLAAANFQELLTEQDGIPYRTASNTPCPIIQNLYLGAAVTGRVYDDTLINEKLNKNGIASAAYVGGQWVIWGAHSADYNQSSTDQINVAETNRMMLYYISNDFQHRRTRDVDEPLTPNDLASIVAEEQMRLDALVQTGALTYGEVHINADEIARSDMYSGDYSFAFRVTTTPLAKSLTAIVTWTPDGFAVYFAEPQAD
jgi:phage tail sheath protein FI